MPAPTRPTSTPAWTQGNPSQQLEPTVSEKFGGYVANQRPPAKKWNWLLGNVSDWIDWLDYATQALLATVLGSYDAVVGTAGTHATINDLMTDPNIATKYRVLVLTAQTLAATQIINKNDIEFVFKPSAVYSKGAGGSPGISITAQRVRIRGGRFASWNTAGDKAIQLEAASRNCLIDSPMFYDCDTAVNDLGTNNTISNPIEEV